MERSKVFQKLQELMRLQRVLEELAEELDVGDISEDKIYISIVAYRSVLKNLLKEENGQAIP